MKNALQSGPVITGVQAYESLWSEAVATTGVIPMPKPKERQDVSLSVSVVGYDDAKKLLKFQHSWGTEWGDHGTAISRMIIFAHKVTTVLHFVMRATDRRRSHRRINLVREF